MELATLAERHGSFYVPAFEVRVDGQALTETRRAAVSQVEVDLALNAAGRFSFTVVNAYDDKKHAFLSDLGQPLLEQLRFGSKVEIAVGYGDHAGLTTVLNGVITEITTGFAEGGSPDLSVAGYDQLFPMTLGKRSRNWKKQADSDIVNLIAKEYKLNADVQTTKANLEQTEQNQESDFEFLKKLAGRNHFEFYVSAERNGRSTLRFGKPRDEGSAVVTLKWGAGLLSFKPEANLAAQVSSVEVYGWDDQKKERIVGRATAGEESGKDAQRKTAGQLMQAAFAKSPVLQVRQPVFTEDEARRRAQAILNDHAKKFLTGDAECVGLPELRPDRNVELANLGDTFSKTYYISQTIHKVDGGGYRTRVKVKETSL